MEEDYTDKVETQVAQDILHLFGAPDVQPGY